MDAVGWFLATSHQMLGHDMTAAIIGMSVGDKAACILCQYEANPTEAKRREVVEAIGTRHL